MSEMSYLRSRERAKVMARRRSAAASAVAKAVKQGDLPPATTVACTDCGKPAFCYDHRDYLQPLLVEPVCKRCDCLRGAGAPYDGMDPRWESRRIATHNRLTAA